MSHPFDADRSFRRADTGRVEAFSDGVMAIAITLLVLNLSTPTAADVQARGGLLGALLDRWPAYLAYLAAFLTIGIIWLNHHAFVDKIARFDKTLHWWNLVLLLGVITLPFPTSVLAAWVRDGGANAQVAAAFYAVVSMVMAGPWSFMWRHLRRHPWLLEHPYDAAYAARESRRGVFGLVVYAGAAIIAIVVPIAALGLFIGIAVFYAITSEGIALDPRAVGEPEQVADQAG